MTEASGQHFQDPAPAELAKLYPPLPVKPVCRGFGHWKDECPKARKEEEAPAVVGFTDLEIN